ncbi:MAG: primosomal protein N' [Anaerolineae bacterium]|nr:primosomal protein N' [Anaerolineae bacterium]
MFDSVSQFAEVAVYQANVRRTFHYAVPDDLPVEIGHLVQVSFRTGLSQGIVLALTDESPVQHAKPIQAIIVPEPVVTPTQIAFARWLADHTLSPLANCLWLMLPPGIAKRGGVRYRLAEPESECPPEGKTLAAQVIALLCKRGALTAKQLDRALPDRAWREAIRPLLASGRIVSEPILPEPDAEARTVRIARLLIPPERVPSVVQAMSRSPKQAAALLVLAEQGGECDVSDLMRDSGASLHALRQLAAKELIEVSEAERYRDPLADRHYPPQPIPTLTAEQDACWQAIRAAQDGNGGAFLLHGVTGAGKTEIYLRAIEHALSQGRQALVLVPEIALVAQTVSRFASRFQGQVAVVHSALTDGEQYDTWRRARNGEIGVVIGARSALFTPLPDIGVVVIDEEHDESYKQSPPLPPPYYHAREAALALMRLQRGVVILGSATPDVVTTFRARRGELTYLRLPNRVVVPLSDSNAAPEAVAAPLPPVTVVDMRQELRAGNRSMFSTALRQALQETLARGEQALLFLNRRGAATFVLCRDCGYVARCPECDIPLTFHKHGESGQLLCHYCGYQSAALSRCPQCNSGRIRYFGAGTASVAEAVESEFTGARVLRWDRDTAQERGAHEAIWTRFAAGEADVLVGTQMIVKGLDLPRVTLVGVMLAETALSLPDYRAAERTFQLLTQAAGRAGRGWRGGKVILQTYQPEHYAIQAAAHHDYETFYERELEYRRLLDYPPYKRLVRLLFSAPSPVQAQREAETAAEMLRARIRDERLTATRLIGPTTAHFAKLDGVYYWHILARTTDPARLIGDLGVHWVVDVDPVETL